MRITINIPDETHRELKTKSAREGKSLREVVLRALQHELQYSYARPTVNRQKFELPLIRSNRQDTIVLTPEQIDEIAFS